MIYRDSRVSKSVFMVVAIILKFCFCMGCPAFCECSRIAEKGGDDKGRLVLMEIPLCSPTLHESWRLVDPRYRALQLKHSNL